MRSRLSLLIFITALILTSCSPSGGAGGGATKSGVGTTGNNPFGSDDDDGSSSSSNSVGPITGVSLRYKYPNVPTKAGALQYYITSFGAFQLGKGGIKPRDVQKELAGNKPPEQIKIEPAATSNGAHYCFSNDQHAGGPECTQANDDVRQHIKEHQNDPTGRHPVFISALEFNFRNAPKDAGGNYSEVIWDGAYVEKAPIVFNRDTGALETVQDQHLMKMSYGNAGTGCRIDQPNAVGFDPPSYMNREFYLSGIWTFERSGRQIFANEVDQDVIQDPHWCETEGVGQYMCFIFADKVKVFHSVLMPILYKSGRVSHRQYPSQVISNKKVIGAPAASESTYGRYATDNSLTVVKVPKGANANAVIGKTDNNGNVISGWDKYFIRKLCLIGTRVDKNVYDEEDPIINPVVNAMRVELRSPYVKILR